MPVRKIPKNHLVVTGAFASKKTGSMVPFESLLEKEFMLLLDFDDRVLRYEGQPVKIPLSLGRSYVPDVLVEYNDGFGQPQLVEIKRTEDLQRNAEKYAEKFEAARVYAHERDWQFSIKTENDIRTPRLRNLKFLRGYRRYDIDPGRREKVLSFLARHNGASTSEAVLSNLATAEVDRADWLPSLWVMVLSGDLAVNLDQPLPDDVPIWLSGGM